MLLSFGIPYYGNPMMLSEQMRVWCGYPEDLKREIEVVLVDDGSPADVAAMTVPRPEGLPPLRIYRVLKDIPWHQHGARNLAAKEAIGEWLFLTDMDHVLPAESLRDLLSVFPSAGPKDAFTFFRVDAPGLKPTVNERGALKPHVNTFALRRDHFWRVGGYDEDCVGYGTDSYFRKRLFAASHLRHLAGIPIIRYPREVIADASSFAPGVDPRELRNKGRRAGETRERLERKQATNKGPRVLDFPWERVL